MGSVPIAGFPNPVGYLLHCGLSLKQVGDHLGHRNLGSTRIYAKVDLAALREVAQLNLRGLV